MFLKGAGISAGLFGPRKERLSMTKKVILDCGHTPSDHSEISTGYGEDSQGRKFCYEDAGIQDLNTMFEEGRITLYVTKEDGQYFVTNWPGSLKFKAQGQTRNNAGGFGSQRTDVWFDFDGSQWHGVNRGDSQLTSCRRTKRPGLAGKGSAINGANQLRQIAEDRTNRETK